MKPGKKAMAAADGASRPASEGGQLWLWAAMVVGAGVLGFAWWFRERILWDFRLCYCAAWLYRHGQNPFDNALFFSVSGEDMPFAYPLPTTLFYMPLTWLDWPIAARVWLVGSSAVLGGLVFFWWRHFGGSRRHSWFPLLALMSFNLAVPKAVLTGNAVTVESALLWGAFYLLVKGNVRGFVALLLPAASFKLLPLLFLGLPLVHPQLRRWKTVASGAALFAAYLAISYLLAPGWFNQYLANVSFNVKEWSQIDVLAPSTYGLSRRLVATVCPAPGASGPLFSWALWGVMSAAVLGMSWKVTRAMALRPWSENGLSLILYATLVYVLVSPRMSDYSYILVIPATLYAAGTLPSPRSWLLLIALLVPLPFISFREPGSGTLLAGDFYFGLWAYWNLFMVFVSWCVFTKFIINLPETGGHGRERELRRRQSQRATQR